VTRERAWDIDCQDLVELVTDYLEGALDDELRMTIDEHLRLCSACAEFVEQMRVTVRELGRIPPETPLDLPDEVRQRLLSAFRAEPR
jgi:predicted anti-sigma-YlaC factor YlaD